MRLALLYVVLLTVSFLPASSSGLDQPLILPVWPRETVGDFGKIGPERVRDPADSPTRNAKWITGVTKPTISVFRPARNKNTHTALVICPGGGYWNLAWDLEGEEVAEWFNKAGITGIVLKYRVPRRPGQPEPLPAPGPVLDVQRAISIVRSRAKEWVINPDRIGITGFSAGGHLALTAATNFDKRAYEPIDDIDKTSCRPDFAIPVYSGYLIDEKTKKLASYIRIPSGTPPVMLVHASDDTVSDAEHSVVMYQALKRAGVPSELHVYSEGGHGFGVRKSPLPCSTWGDRALAWLHTLKLLNP
jgi:acetyl esterase/lipase